MTLTSMGVPCMVDIQIFVHARYLNLISVGLTLQLSQLHPTVVSRPRKLV